MDGTITNVIIGLSSAVACSGITATIVKRTTTKQVTLKIKNEYSEKTEIIKQNAIEKHKAEDGYKAIMDNEYLKGKADGAKEELSKFTIHYTPFIDEHDSFLKKSLDAGIEMQIFYGGLPVADPMRRVTKHEEKFKEENLKYIIDKVNDNIKVLADVAMSSNIPVRITQEPKREDKGKKGGK